MHLGQTASFLAEVLNRPEPKIKMLSRLLREGGWIKKGSRGRNAPHIDSTELSSFLIACMCSPDSPAVSMERLDHFASLRLDVDEGAGTTFGYGLSILLDRLAAEPFDRARIKNWSVKLQVDMSAAEIAADPSEKSEESPEEHFFSSLAHAPDDQNIKDALPYFGGLEFCSTIRVIALLRIAQVILGGKPDPIDEILKSLEEAK